MYLSLDVLAWEKNNRWIGQCLQLDVCSSSDTFEDLVYEMHRMIVGAMILRGDEETTFQPFKSAPERFWEDFQTAAPVKTSSQLFHNSVGEEIHVPELIFRVKEWAAS